MTKMRTQLSSSALRAINFRFRLSDSMCIPEIKRNRGPITSMSEYYTESPSKEERDDPRVMGRFEIELEKISELTTEAQRHREEMEKDESHINLSGFSLCLCASVVNDLSHTLNPKASEG